MLISACLEALAAIGHGDSSIAIRRRFPDLAALPDFLLASCLKAKVAAGSAAEFDEVARLLFARGPHLRSAILGALAAMCPRPVPPALDGPLLAALRGVAEDGDPPLCRYQAVRVLGLWAGRDDVAALLASLLSSAERLVRLAAAESLRASDRPDVPGILAVRARQERDEEVLQALGRSIETS
jgi:hypothetical protein